MDTIYDHVAETSLPEEKMDADREKRILDRAMAQIRQETPHPAVRFSWWKRGWRVAVAVAALCCLGALGATAAARFLQPSQVAQQMDQQELAALFTGENAVSVEQTLPAGRYTVTLLGLTSGENVTGYWSSDWTDGIPADDRQYAVLAITHTDGTPMAELADPDSDLTLQNSLISPVFASADYPLMDYNVYSMNGARHDLVQDGVRYVLIETDTVEPFADKNPQLAVILDYESGISGLLSGFVQDPVSGEITVAPEGEGTRLLFDLPIPESKADPERAAVLCRQWFSETEQPAGEEDALAEDVQQSLDSMTPEQVKQTGTLQGSENVAVTDGARGKGWYYGDGQFMAYVDDWGDVKGQSVVVWTGDGRVMFLHHEADDTLTVETWTAPVP